MRKIMEQILEIKVLHERGVPLKSKLIKDLGIQLEKDYSSHCQGIDLNKLILYVALNCEFIFNSKKCFHFLCLLGDNEFYLFDSYSKIRDMVGKRIHKKLGRCETFLGWLEGQDIITVCEIGKTKGKKCIIILSEKIINKIQNEKK